MTRPSPGRFSSPARRFLPALAAITTLGIGALGLARQQAGNAGAQGGGASMAGTGITGLTEPSTTIKIGFDIRGVVAKVDVKRNDKVKAGQPLISLEDGEEQATLEYYKRRADTTLQVAEAEQTFNVRTIEFTRKQEIYEKEGRKSGSSELEMKSAEAEMNIAKIKIDQAKHEGEVAQAQADAQAARVARMHKSSPVDGEVRDVTVKPGEQVDETKPVLEIVDLDPLYVEVTLVDTQLVQKLNLGDKLQVKYADESQWREAEVESIDPSADRRSGKHPFRLKLANTENRKAGLRVDVRLPAAIATAQ